MSNPRMLLKRKGCVVIGSWEAAQSHRVGQVRKRTESNVNVRPNVKNVSEKACMSRTYCFALDESLIGFQVGLACEISNKPSETRRWDERRVK